MSCKAELFVLALWCFSPSILGHGQLITPDVGAAALGVAAAYAFRRWLREPGLPWMFLAGTTLGLAELAKTTWILLFLLWPLLWLVWQFFEARSAPLTRPRRRLAGFLQLAAIVVLSLWVLNLGYGCEGSFTRLGDYGFVSEALTGENHGSATGMHIGNRFSGAWAGRIHLPVPTNYLMGIDVQKSDFEQGLPSYLHGRWANRGWWYYYLYAMAVKMPLGLGCLAILAIGGTVFVRGHNAPAREEILLLAPGLALIALVSSQTGFSAHARYVIPSLPFLFLWTSKVAGEWTARSSTKGSDLVRVITVVAVAWSIASSLWVYPHSISYFNELTGGPRHGADHLLESNIDWGQDLFYLQEWLASHPDVQLEGLAYFGPCPPLLAGIPPTPRPPVGPPRGETGARPSTEDTPGPRPGWYALSLSQLHDVSGQYRYFLLNEPDGMAGYSIYIYHVTQSVARP